MKLIVIIFSILIFILPLAKGQTFLEKIRSGNANFYEVMDEYNEWVKEHGELTKAQGRNEVRRFFRERFFYSDEKGNLIKEVPVSSEQYYQLKRVRQGVLKSTNAGPSWQPFGPLKLDEKNSSGYNPGYAVVRCVTTEPGNSGVIYAGLVSAGVWKSEDEGQTWVYLTPNEPIREVSSLAVGRHNTSFVLAGATSFGLIRSYDGGQSWDLTNLSYHNKSITRIRSIELAPDDDDHIIAGTDQGVYVSFDGGDTWQKTDIDVRVDDIAIHPDNGNIIYAFSVSDGKQPTLFKSTDGGKTFFEKANGLPDKMLYGTSTYGRLAVTPAASGNVYLLIAGRYNNGSGLVGVFTSTDEGESFSFQCCGDQPGGASTVDNPNLMGYSTDGTEAGGQWSWDMAFEVSKTDPGKVYLGGIMLWISSDQGENFSSYGTWSIGSQDRSKYIHCDIQHIYDAGDKLYLTSDGGIYVSENNAESFTNITHGISGTETWAPAGLSRINPNIAITGTFHNGILYLYDHQTPDGWRHVYGGDAQLGKVNVLNHIISNDGGGTSRISKDGGQNWSAFGGQKGMNFEISPVCVDHITGVAKGNIYQSYDGGGSFTEVYNTDLSGGYTYEHGQIAMAKSNSDVIYASYEYGKNLVKSTDGGLTWKALSLPWSSMRIYDIEVDPENEEVLYITNLGIRTGNNIYRSEDGGETWNDFSEGLESTGALSLKCQAGTDGGIYLGTISKGVYYRNSTLGKWVDFNGDLPLKTKVIGLHINYAYNKLYITTGGRGIWTTSLYESSSAPLAGISVDRTELFFAGDTVQFYENSFYSNPSDVTFEWEFPGGSPAVSTEANPKVSYNEAGIYGVTLKVTDGNGEDTQVLNELITLDGGSVCGYEEEAKTCIQCVKEGYITIPPLDKELSSMTMSCWIKPAGDQLSYAGLIFHRSENATAGLNFRDNNELGYHWGSGKYNWRSGAYPIIDQWNYVALVIEPEKATLYLNDNEYEYNSTHEPNLFNSLIKIGADYEESREYYGLIDEVKIWDRALSPEEIRQQKYVTATADDHLLAYYQFNQTNENYVFDATGNSRGNKPMNLYRVTSTVPVGGGVHAENILSDNMIRFEGTGLSLKTNFEQVWYVNKINQSPNVKSGIPMGIRTTAYYWIIEAETNNHLIDIQIQLTEEQLSMIDEFTTFNLYAREFNGEGKWDLINEEGVYNEEVGTVVFNQVNHSGQILMGIKQGTGLSKQEADLVKLWPNPVTSKLNIKWAKPEDLRYEIFNANGQLLYHGNNHGRQEFSVHFSKISSGYYLIRIKDASGYTLTKRFMVK